MNEDIILTINIPTYNRAGYLARCLNSIHTQLNGDIADKIKVGVFDNASPDNTGEIVALAIAGGLAIEYVRNASNIGPDNNIKQAYLSAKSKYVLVLGDDDVLLPGLLSYLVAMLQSGDYGLVFLNFYQFLKDPISEYPRQFNKNTYLYKGEKILAHVLSNIAFISSNVVNTKYLSQRDMDNTTGTALNQIPGIINAAKSDNNVFINKYYLAQQKENSGGFHYFKVFGENFALITSSHLSDTSKAKKQILGHLLKHVFPYHLYQLSKHDRAEADSVYQLLKKHYKSNLFFWFSVYPLLNFPGIISYVFYTLDRAYNKIFYAFARIHTGKVFKLNETKN